MRAYAPFQQFGGAFKGDAGGPTTSPNVTSRVKTWITFDPVAGKVGTPNAKSNRQMLLTFETTGSAHTGPGRLFGDSKKHMNAISKSFELDDAGLLAGSSNVCSSVLEVQ